MHARPTPNHNYKSLSIFYSQFFRPLSLSSTSQVQPHKFIMRSAIRATATKAIQKVAEGASLLQYSAFGAPSDDGGYNPLVGSPAKAGRNKKNDPEDGERRARKLRTGQDQKESSQREKDLANLTLVQAAGAAAQRSRLRSSSDVQQHPHERGARNRSPRQDIPSPQQASIHDGSEHTSPMWEQTIGIIRDQQPVEQEEEMNTNHSSNASSLKRRGAIRRKLNPLFARSSQ
jgi:hypothetical protein